MAAVRLTHTGFPSLPLACKQGGVTNNAAGMVRATLPVAFSTPLTAVGTVTAATGSSSKNNLDDAVTLTSTYVQFAYYQHNYLAFGL